MCIVRWTNHYNLILVFLRLALCVIDPHCFISFFVYKTVFCKCSKKINCKTKEFFVSVLYQFWD